MSKKLIQLVAVVCGLWLPLSGIHAQNAGDSGFHCYTPGSTFQHNEDPNCYTITLNEADQAYAKGCWEDASKLYRAAKLCRDATQTNRNFINTRIKACSDAAEAELQDERDKAVRQARQAIASNRANDAQELLRKNDRSTAYRLAKFANEYIAPAGEVNPDCLQAIFDAWQQKAPVTNKKIQPVLPFCYELLHTTDDSVTVRFHEKKGKIHLFAFSPKRHELYEWEAPAFKLIGTTRIDSTMREFDLAPDGETMLFRSANVFILSKNGKRYPVGNLPNTLAYCFSPDSKSFFYFDQSQMSVNSMFLDDIFMPSRDKKSNKGPGMISTPRSNVRVAKTPACLAFAQSRLWMIYKDSVFFYQTIAEKSGRSGWGIDSKTALQFPVDSLIQDKNFRMSFNDELQTITLSNNEAFQSSEIKYNNGVFTSAPGQIYVGKLVSDQHIWIPADINTSSKLYYQRGDSLLESVQLGDYASFYWHKGGSIALSDDPLTISDEWLAISDASGLLRLWRLSGNFSGKYKKIFNTPGTVTCSEDGSSFANCNNGAFAEFASTQNGVQRFGRMPFTENMYGSMAEVSSTGWIAAAVLPNDTIQLFNSKKSWQFVSSGSLNPVFMFDHAGQYFAYASGDDSLDVFQLQGDEIRHIAGRKFDAMIDRVSFIPQKDALIVQRTLLEGEASGSVTIPKIWYFKSPAKPLQSVRMEKYFSYAMSADADGQNIYFTDGNTVRIFDINNLTDEKVSIRQRKGVTVEAIAAHPAAPVIAVAYSDGTIVCANSDTGKKLFQLVAGYDKTEQNTDHITRIAFVNDGKQLIAIINDKYVQYFDLDIFSIQQQISLTGGQLVAFAPEQIGHWELDKVLDYEGNFEKLAGSGDQPLIYAFFNFFSSQAQYSNRIDEVEFNCSRASDLYELLDDESQKTQKTTMLSMYDDFLWKLIQRNKLNEAEAVIRQQSTPGRFPSALPFIRAGAHIALMKNNLKTAARLYVEWMEKFDRFSKQNYDYSYVTENQVSSELEQLYDYGYLGAEQRALVCAIFASYQTFGHDFCSEEEPETYMKRQFGEDDIYLRWKLFHLAYQFDYVFNEPFITSLKRLDSMLVISRKLEKKFPEYKQKSEALVIRTANIYLAIGDFEKSTSDSLAYLYFTKAINLLESQRAFSKNNELDRLDTLGGIYLLRGATSLLKNPQRALEDFKRCDDILKRMETLYGNPELTYYSLAWALFIQTGQAFLLLDKPDKALVMFEKADSIVTTSANYINMAHAYLLQQNTIDASLNYGYIENEDELAQTLASISLYSMRFKNQPARYQQIQQYAADILKAGFLENHPEFDPQKVEFEYMANMIRIYTGLGQLDSAYILSRKQYMFSRKVYESTTENAANHAQWLKNLCDAAINLTQYVIFLPNPDRQKLDEALQYSLQTLAETRKIYVQGSNLLYINNGHIYMLLADTAKALESYQLFDILGGSGSHSYFDYLLKDWRDQYRAGIRLRGLDAIVKEIFPEDYPFSADDLKAIGR